MRCALFGGEAGYGRISVLARVYILVHPNGVEGEVLSLQGGGGEGWAALGLAGGEGWVT